MKFSEENFSRVHLSVLLKFAKANFYSPEKILVFAFLDVHRPYKWKTGTLDE